MNDKEIFAIWYVKGTFTQVCSILADESDDMIISCGTYNQEEDREEQYAPFTPDDSEGKIVIQYLGDGVDIEKDPNGKHPDPEWSITFSVPTFGFENQHPDHWFTPNEFLHQTWTKDFICLLEGEAAEWGIRHI